MNDKTIGNFTFVLHFHLPYVLAHGRWPHGMDWLNEAAAETYLPILDVLNGLVDEGLSPKITIGITPVLTEQLSDPTFAAEFESYLGNKIQAAQADRKQFEKWGETHRVVLAEMWEEYYKKILDHFQNRYSKNLIVAFKKLQDAGHIEIITCAATHGYLPLLSRDESVQAQIKQGVATYRKHYGRAPRGIWLPECAYRPRYTWTPPVESVIGNESYPRKGVEEFLSENGLLYFIIDAAMLQGGKAIGVYLDRFEALQKLWSQFSEQYKERELDVEKTPQEVYMVSSAPETSRMVAVLTRDPQTSLQVWSGEWGYPGDGWYLDFHKKHFPGGHRYWRVTSAQSDLADKKSYEPSKALARLPEHAHHFVSTVKDELRSYNAETGKSGIVCSPFDAELFGHWWFEGTEFLGQVLRIMANDPEINLTTGSALIEENPPSRVISLPEGSWGEGGYHYIWLNEWTEWTWKHIYEDEVRMKDLVGLLGQSNQDEQLIKILKQAARELLLLESSDWQFLISTWSARDYAEMRFDEHHNSFLRLAEIATRYAKEGKLSLEDQTFLENCYERDKVFEEIDLNWFAEVEYPV